MDKREQILKTIRENRQTMRSFGVRRLGLFGSYALGKATASSDIDFLVEFEKKTFDAYMGLKFFLENLFHRNVDLVIKDSLKPRLQKTVLKQVIYA